MKNRFLSVILALTLILSCVATSALAASTFPDVLSPDHDWAAEQIEEMTELGIIKGYTDGTFKPDRAISKIEALILFSRVAGYSNDAYAEIAEFAYEKYQYLLEEDTAVKEQLTDGTWNLVTTTFTTGRTTLVILGDTMVAEAFAAGAGSGSV